jgi:enoyl-CoA hydratase/carnithine racemase
MKQRIKVSIQDHVAIVMLDRADKRNAVDLDMFQAFLRTRDELVETPGIRAVILHGDGPDFCAGIDISVFGGRGIGADGPDITAPLENSAANIVQSAALVWRELPVPVIAALHGATFGAGLQIAMGADLRIAAPDVRMSVMEVRWGLIPDMGITNTFRHVVRQDFVRELTYTGRIVAAPEARDMGLVTRVCEDPLSAATEIAAEIAGKSPDAVRAAKRLINESWDADPDEALRMEATLQHAVLAGENQREAASANLEKRLPQFTDPSG